MVNNKQLEVMPQTTVTLLPTVSSDHSPLLLEMTTKIDHAIKYFKFLKFWVEQHGFLETVKSCWDRDLSGKPIWVFHQILRRLSSTLSNQPKVQFGDMHAKVRSFKERIKNSKEELISQATDTARISLHSLNTKYIKFLKSEESILRQKSQLHWFQEGDINIGYFHALLRGRRRR